MEHMGLLGGLVQNNINWSTGPGCIVEALGLSSKWLTGAPGNVNNDVTVTLTISNAGLIWDALGLESHLLRWLATISCFFLFNVQWPLDIDESAHCSFMGRFSIRSHIKHQSIGELPSVTYLRVIQRYCIMHIPTKISVDPRSWDWSHFQAKRRSQGLVNVPF